MGSMFTKPSDKKTFIIHIKKAVIKNNVIYMIDKDYMATVVPEKLVKIEGEAEAEAEDSIAL
jgi:hypothetical protein